LKILEKVKLEKSFIDFSVVVLGIGVTAVMLKFSVITFSAMHLLKKCFKKEANISFHILINLGVTPSSPGQNET